MYARPQLTIPPGHVRLKGAVRYWEATHEIAVPGLRVVLKGGGPPRELRTDDDGHFDVIVPEGTAYSAVLVADVPGGKVNRVDDAGQTWASAELPLTACGARTYCLDYRATDLVEIETLRISGIIRNAVRALASAGIDGKRLGPLTVMLKTADVTYTTDTVGGNGFVWLHRGDGHVVNHEIGHALAIRANKYLPWAADHGGCDEVGWPRREFAFFEGWADFVAFTIRDTPRGTCVPRRMSHCQETNHCLTAASPGACGAQFNNRPGVCTLTLQRDEVEDYVANTLIEFRILHDPTSQILMDTFYSTEFSAQLRTIGGFQAALQQRDPIQGARLRAIMTAYGMP